MSDQNVQEAVLPSARRPKQPTTTGSSENEIPIKSDPQLLTHFVLQAKGGCGKSFVSWCLAQWHSDSKRAVACFDTDPLNVTFSSYPALSAEHIEIMAGDEINVAGMDGLVDKIVQAPGSSVVDNGSSGFLPVASYLTLNESHTLLAEHGRRLVIHTVVAGGPAALFTLGGMAALLDQFPADVPIVVWVNEHEGDFRVDGKSFEETQAYIDHAKRIAGVVFLLHEDPRFHGKDVKKLMDGNLTFAEAHASPDFTLAQKARLHQVKRRIFDQLDRIMPAL